MEELVAELGFRHERGGWLCPFHRDTNPSLGVRSRGYRCFACGARGDAITLVMEFCGLGFRDAVEYLADRAGVRLGAPGRRRVSRRLLPPRPVVRPTQPSEPPAITPERRVTIYTDFASAARLREGTSQDHPAVRYLRGRGISLATAIACGVGAITDYGRAGRFLRERTTLEELQAAGLTNRKGNLRLFAHRLLLPYWLDGEVLGLQARNTDWRGTDDGPKELTVGPVMIPFHADVLLEPKEQVYVCEGAIDTLSLAELGLPAVGVPGARNFRPEWVELFGDAGEVVLALDNDEAGRRGIATITALFAAAGRHVRLLQLPNGIKDINELLTAGPGRGC